MHAEIVTTGTELLLGLISDTNSTYIAQRLQSIGLNLYYITSAGDNRQRIAQVIDTALNRSDVVITTGGLGPTVGDVTREAVADATGRPLVTDPHLLAGIEAFFARRGYVMTENNRRQAQIPQGAIPLENPVGTAPCFIVEDPRGLVISLPGVPGEMKYMLDNVVLPYLRQKLGLTEVIKTRILRTAGIGESALDAQIADLEKSANPTIGLAAHPGRVDVRIGAKAADEAAADRLLDEMEARLRERLDPYIYGVDQDTLESVVLKLLADCSLTLAVAEVAAGGALTNGLAQDGGTAFCGGLVLPDKYVGYVYADLPAEAAALAHRARETLHADIGLVVINRGPEHAYLFADGPLGQVERTMRFRGHDLVAYQVLASWALDLVRRMCLDRMG